MAKAFATSDVGKAREINEDYFYISYPDDPVQLYILADGMGGYNGGEIASKLAVVTAKNYILSNYEKAKESKETLIDLVQKSCQYANMVVYEKAKENQELSNMGTTMDICLIFQNKAFIAHIGDSRIYRIRKEFLRKLTKDHSYVQQLVDEGRITKEESVNHHKFSYYPSTCFHSDHSRAFFLKSMKFMVPSFQKTFILPSSMLSPRRYTPLSSIDLQSSADKK